VSASAVHSLWTTAADPISKIDAPKIEYGQLSPTLIVVGAAIVGVLIEAVVPRKSRYYAQVFLSAVALTAAFAAVVALAADGYGTTKAGIVAMGAIAVDGPALFLQGTILLAGLVGLFTFAERRLDPEAHGNRVDSFAAQAASVPGSDSEKAAVKAGFTTTEVFPLLLFAVAGMLIFPAANDLLTLFIALEVFSLPLYLMCALARRKRLMSQEAAVKYFLLGAFASAFTLFGIALLYGYAGSVSYATIAQVVDGTLTTVDPALADTMGNDALLLIGTAMLVMGLLFKVGAVPFHMWTPDVYQGAPTSVTAFMSAATKTAALVVTLRILVTAFPEDSDIWTIAVAVIACVSLAWGNLAALVQSDVKRLLAFSSISHAGFMLIAIAAGTDRGAEALLYYLVPYSAMSVGAFAVVAAREREIGLPLKLDGLAGLGWERPLFGAALWVFMLGMAGFPLTGGFFGKLFVFSAAYEAGDWWLVLVGVAATALSLAYYLNVVRWLYMRSGAELRLVSVGGSPPREYALGLAVAAAVLVTVGSFFAAQPILDVASEAAGSLPF